MSRIKFFIRTLVCITLHLSVSVQAIGSSGDDGGLTSISVIGKVVALNKLEVITTNSGYVTRLADIGTKIQKGGTLAKLVNKELQFELKIKQSESEYLKEKIVYMEKLLDQTRQLYSSNGGALNEVENHKHQLILLKSDLDIVNSRIGKVEYNISQLHLQAPFDGVVTKRYTALNQFEQTNGNLLQFVGDSNKALDILLPTKYLSVVDNNSLVNFNNRFGEFSVPVQSIVPQVDPDTSMFQLRILLPQNNWLNNETIRVNISPAVN